jgi:hypothetical protein
VTCSVYIFGHPHAVFHHVVKVGISNNVFSRLDTIQTHNVETVVPHFHFDLPSREMAYEIEQHFHRRFDAYRLRGEWFGMDGNQALYLLSIGVVRALSARYAGDDLRTMREDAGLLRAFAILDAQPDEDVNSWERDWQETEEAFA